MKIRLEHSGLFDPDVKTKLQQALQEQAVPPCENGQVFQMEVFFFEGALADHAKIDAFEIPPEALPIRQRGLQLSTKDKMYALLDYQVDTVIQVLEAFGLPFIMCGICGTPIVAPDCLEIELKPDAADLLEKMKQTSSKRKKDGDRLPKVISIMPSLPDFSKLVNHFFENREKDRREKLTDALGKSCYQTYEALLGQEALYSVYTAFDEEYGSYWTRSFNGAALKQKFLDTVKLRAGQITDEEEKAQISQPMEFTPTLVYAILVYKTTKTSRAVRKPVGHANLLTNGRRLQFSYEPLRKTYALPNALFADCVCEVEEQDGSDKLLNKIRKLADQADGLLLEHGYALEKEVIPTVLSYMNLKALLRSADRQNK